MQYQFTSQREVLQLPEDGSLLTRKLEEYRGRVNEFRTPELQLDTLYKIAVLGPLVTDGTVNRTMVKEELRQRCDYLDEVLFHNAWDVIADYVETGGKRLFGGTGLPIQGEDNPTVRE